MSDEQALVRARYQELSADQIELLKRTVAEGASNDELKLFLHICERTGLDPFAKQIYFIKRRQQRNGQWVDVGQTQTGIDGFRLVAERSNRYAGQLGPYWCGTDGVWKDVWIENTPPAAAKVAVMKDGFKEPLWGVARFRSYAQTKSGGELTAMWAKMPEVMIAKCAESLALRKAFPQELSGLYTDEEMQQAENTEPYIDVTPTPAARPTPTPTAGTAGPGMLPATTRSTRPGNAGQEDSSSAAVAEKVKEAAEIVGRPPTPAEVPDSKPDAPKPSAPVPAGGKCPECKATGVHHKPGCSHAAAAKSGPKVPPPVEHPPAPSGTVFITAINVRNGPMVMKDGISQPAWGPLYVIAFSEKVKATDGTMVSDATTYDEKLATVAEKARDDYETAKASGGDVASTAHTVTVEPGKKKGNFSLVGIAKAVAVEA